MRIEAGPIVDEEENEDLFIYDAKERWSWEVIIILPGVEIIPCCTFCGCTKVETVIMADTVRRIEDDAFYCCYSLKFVKLSTNLEYIAREAFEDCVSLTSIFIPPSYREMGLCVFSGGEDLIIFHIPHITELGGNVIANTALIQASHFEEDELQLDLSGYYQNNEEVNAWIKNMNGDDEFALHRACSSYNPITDIIYEIVKRQGLESFKKENQIGVTPLQYLEENPFADIDQRTSEKIRSRFDGRNNLNM